MAHRYADPVRVTLAKKTRLPTSFTWRDRRYWVKVIGMWHLVTCAIAGGSSSDTQATQTVTPTAS